MEKLKNLFKVKYRIIQGLYYEKKGEKSIMVQNKLWWHINWTTIRLRDFWTVEDAEEWVKEKMERNEYKVIKKVRKG